MNFDLTETQAMLKATVERFGAEAHGHDLEKRRFQRASAIGFDRANWAQLAELGVLALPFAEADGGLDGGPVDCIAVAEAFGAQLATEPFTECLVPAARLISLLAADQRTPLAEEVLSGTAIPALAITEQAGRYNLAHVGCAARESAGGWLLSGAKSAVWQGMAADRLVVSARISGATRDRDGIGLFLVQPGPAVDRRAWRATDGQLAAELTLHEAPAVRLEGLDLASLEAAVGSAWLSASAELLGCATLLFDQTLGYVKQRTQFGKALGSFQVIQHRLADCYVALEQSRSMLYRAALAEGDGQGRAYAGAKAFVSQAARIVAHEAVQMHGGMGVTDELIVGHGLKRIQFLTRLWGDPETAAQHYARAA